MSDKFNIGKDYVMTLLVQGQPIGAIALTKFERKQMTKRLESDPVNGEPNYREVEKGWEGTLEWDRTNSVMDDFFAQKEANLYAGGQNPDVVIVEKVKELNGGVSRFRYTGLTLKFENAGNVQSDEKVTQSASFTGARRLKVA